MAKNKKQSKDNRTAHSYIDCVLNCCEIEREQGRSIKPKKHAIVNINGKRLIVDAEMNVIHKRTEK